MKDLPHNLSYPTLLDDVIVNILGRVIESNGVAVKLIELHQG